MIIIDEATSRELLDMNEAIPWLAESFRAITTGPTVGMRSDVDDPARFARGLLLGSYVGPPEGVSFNAVGASIPLQREPDLAVLPRAAVRAVDSRELALKTGDFLEPLTESVIRPENVVELS